MRRRFANWMGAPGSSRRVLARNALWNWGSFVLEALVLAFLSPYMVRELGNGAYGYWEAVLQFIGYLAIADLGVRPAIVHFVARHDALRSHGEVNRYVNTAFVTLAGGSAVVMIGACIAAPFAPEWFGVSEAYATETMWATVLAGATLAFSLPWNAYSAVLIGKQRFDVSCRIDVITLLLRAALIVVALVSGLGLLGVAAAAAISSWVEMAWKTRAAFRIEPRLRFRPRLLDWSKARQLLAYGGLGLVVMFASRLTYETDNLVIGLGKSVEWVALFAFAAKLAHYTRGMMYSIGRVLTPAVGAIEAREAGSSKRLSALLTAGTRGMLLVSGPLLIFWCVLGGAFLETWVGDRAFRVHGAVPLMVLAIGAVAPIASYPLVAAHYGTNRMRSLAILSGLEGVLNVGLSIALVHPLGLLGVALGTTIPGFLVHGLLMPWWICSEFRMSIPRFVKNAWLVPMAAAAITVPVMLLLFDPGAQYGWGALIGAGLVCTAVFLGSALLVTRLAKRFLDDAEVYTGLDAIATPPARPRTEPATVGGATP
ncbi:MAG: polysaccharide biosynthesis C-terminal domain-containing protein [Planctomycetota bacterium]|nr:polysaccharide biosynthesis C-terminal domain-containing protein [Planctomycetota bacterium]